jgi:ribosomal protein L35
MPKLKTNKTADKRIKKITSSGKVIRRKTLAQHLVKRKTARTINQSGNDMLVSRPEAKKIKMLLPYK